MEFVKEPWVRLFPHKGQIRETFFASFCFILYMQGYGSKYFIVHIWIWIRFLFLLIHLSCEDCSLQKNKHLYIEGEEVMAERSKALVPICSV